MLVLLFFLLAPALQGQTGDEPLRHSMLASQIFLAAAGGAHIAASSTARVHASTGLTTSHAGLVSTVLVIEVLTMKHASRKWKILTMVGNLAAGALLVNYASNDVQRSRRMLHR